jgi:tRNA A-37 threonylcarbamoyl transferase component Bud32
VEEKKVTILKGRYRLVERIGRGAMGTVFMAEDTVMERRVAIKVLRLPEELPEKAREEAVKRFYREARLAGKLIHPNIVATFDIDQEGTHHFISMELVEGETLSCMLEERKTLDPLLAVGIAQQVCEALDYAHAYGVVHRDIKPGNVFIVGGEKVKVGDFGIARSMDSSTLTQTGYSLGTPQYMSPEQVRGEGMDPRSDIFSLGVVLYEMLEGMNPFSADTPHTVIYNILEKEPPLLEGKGYALPGLKEVLDKALRKDVDSRYQTAGEMSHDLKALLEGRKVVAAPLPTPPPMTDQPAAAPPVAPAVASGPAPAMPAAKEKKKGRRWPLVAGGALVGALVLFIVLVLITGGEENRPGPTEPIERFLTAVIEGRMRVAEALLTDVAKEEIDMAMLRQGALAISREAGGHEVFFTRIEEGDDSASVQVWMAGGDRDYDLGLWRLVWVDDRWFIEKPGYLTEIGKEPPPEEFEEPPPEEPR